MTTSSMVCIRCALARLAVLPVLQLMHAQALINTGPGETGFAPARLEVSTGLVNRVKEQITCKLELLWTVMSM